MSEDNKTEDWEMSHPHGQLDDETRKIVDAATPTPAEQAPEAVDEDYGHTAASINLDPIAMGSDDWGLPETRITTEEKQSDWHMPDPVFRVSPGETPNFEHFGETDFSDGFTAQSPPESGSSEAGPEPAVVTPTVAPRKKSGAGKWILLLVGIVGLLVVLTAAAVGIYILWFTGKSEVRSVSNEKVEATEPTKSETVPVKTKSEFPKSITLKGEMLLIGGGEFTMGSDSDGDESKPAHKVRLEAFYIDKYEVTNADYKEFCDATGRSYPTEQFWDPTYFKSRPNAPVLGVSFDDAKAYAEWAGKRLPTEAEWEKAASWDESSASKRAFPWGAGEDSDKSAFGIQMPSDVGRFERGVSAYGVHDLAGNAAEWVDSWFAPYPGNTSANPNFDGSNRVVRGGYFGSKSIDSLKTTKRIYVLPNFVPKAEKASYIGFRCAVSADRVPAQRESK